MIFNIFKKKEDDRDINQLPQVYAARSRPATGKPDYARFPRSCKKILRLGVAAENPYHLEGRHRSLDRRRNCQRYEQDNDNQFRERVKQRKFGLELQLAISLF